MIKKRPSVVIAYALQNRVGSALRQLGEVRLSNFLACSGVVLLRAACGLPVSRGTASLIEHGMAKIEDDHLLSKRSSASTTSS